MQTYDRKKHVCLSLKKTKHSKVKINYDRNFLSSKNNTILQHLYRRKS